MSTSKYSGLPQQLWEGLDAVCQKYQGTSDQSDTVVVFKDDILALCKQHGFCTAMTLHVKQLGPHPSNRDGEGLVAERGQSRVSVIKKGGMSLSTIRPNCVVMEDNPNTRAVAKFTVDICSMSPKFAQLEFSQIKGGTLGAGHATQGFAQLHDEVPCDIEAISENGRMSKKKCFDDRNIKAAVEKGLEYDFIDHRIEVAFPIIPHIIQSALNTVQQVSEGENWHSLLMKIVNEASKTFPKIDWKQVKKAVLKSQPPRPQDVPDMVDFVAKWGGLPTGTFVKQLSELCSVFVPSERTVAAKFFSDLSALKFPAAEMPADFVAAFFFTHVNSKEKVQDGQARYLQGSDISDALSNTSSAKLEKYKRIQLANTIIQRMRGLLEENTGIPKHHRLHLMKDLQVACVEAALQRKGTPEQRDLPTIAADVSAKFANFLKGEFNTAQPTPTDDTDEPPLQNVIAYTSDGSAADVSTTLLTQCGFKIGDFVKPKKGTCWEQFQIKAIGSDADFSVEFSRVDPVEGTVVHDSLTTMSLEKFASGYTSVVGKNSHIEIVEKYPAIDPSESLAFQQAVLQGHLVDSLFQLSVQHAKPNVRMFRRPEVRVLALEAFEVGMFVAVPSTTNISVYDPLVSKLWLRTVIATVGDTKFALHPMENKEFMAVAWNVKVVHEKDKANCTMESKHAHGKHFTIKKTNTNQVIDVDVPCIVNCKAIQKHDEIVLYRPRLDAPSVGIKRGAPINITTAKAQKI